MSIGELEEVLEVFYGKYFPFAMFHEWLGYGDPLHFGRREFSLTLAGDVYLRFQSYVDGAEMAEKIQRARPRKIDIGAVYNARPSEKRFQGGAFQPVERELIIDIDLTDYDQVRTCCQDKKICGACWKFIVVAVRVIDDILLADFGFRNRLWVFSGRRGVHCWVADQRARVLSAHERRALLSFIELVKGGEEQKKKVHLTMQDSRLHPSIQRSLKYIEPIFHDHILNEQDILDSPEKCSRFLALIPDESLSKQLQDGWKTARSSSEKWAIFQREMESVALEKKKKSRIFPVLKEELMLQYTYPRLDANVSIQMNHLLKSPFCVHPDTGNYYYHDTGNDINHE